MFIRPFRTSLFASVCWAPDGGAGELSVPAPAPKPSPAQSVGDEPPPNLSAAELLTLLRDKGRSEANYRTKLREAEALIESERREKETLTASHNAALESIKTAERERTMKAEIRIEAMKAGIIDPEALALLDLGKAGVKIDKDGNVTGAAEAIAAFKGAKGYLFEGTGSTSRGGKAPAPNGDGPAKKATEMTTEEWKASRAALLAQR